MWELGGYYFDGAGHTAGAQHVCVSSSSPHLKGWGLWLVHTLEAVQDMRPQVGRGALASQSRIHMDPKQAPSMVQLALLLGARQLLLSVCDAEVLGPPECCPNPAVRTLLSRWQTLCDLVWPSLESSWSPPSDICLRSS